MTKRMEDITTTRALALCAMEAVLANLRTECGVDEWRATYVPPSVGKVTRDPEAVEEAVIRLMTNLYHYVSWHRLNFYDLLLDAKARAQRDVLDLDPV